VRANHVSAFFCEILQVKEARASRIKSVLIPSEMPAAHIKEAFSQNEEETLKVSSAANGAIKKVMR